jgi:hypothetical protein
MVEEKKEVTNDENEELKTDKTDTSENEEQTEMKTDSKPEAASEDTKPKEVKEEVKETKPDTEKTEEKTPPEPLKKKKVNQMTLVEIEAQLRRIWGGSNQNMLSIFSDVKIILFPINKVTFPARMEYVYKKLKSGVYSLYTQP